MSKLTAIFMTIGAMIGSAIFTLSGATIFNAGAWSILSWVLAGIISLSYGFIVSQLAEQYEGTSGITYFNKIAFNNIYFSKVCGVFYSVSCIFGLLFSLKTLGAFFPGFPTTNTLIITVICLTICYFGLSITGKINLILTIVLIAILVGFSLWSIINAPGFGISIEPGAGTTPSAEAATPSLPKGNILIAGLGQTPLAILGYGAIVMPAFMASKINRSKTGKSQVNSITAISLLITGVVYVLTIIGFLVLGNNLTKDNMYTIFTLYNSPVFNFGFILALFTTCLGLTQLVLTSFEALEIPGAPAKISLGAILIIAVLFLNNIEFIINSGSLMNIVFMVSICISGFKLLRNKILPLITAVVLIALLIGNLLNNLILEFIVTGAITIVTIVVVALINSKSKQ